MHIKMFIKSVYFKLLLFVFCFVSIVSKQEYSSKEFDFRVEIKKIPLYKRILTVFFMLNLLGNNTFSTVSYLAHNQGYFAS
mgnify:CR=1 FL=1|jgi:hypothetical protein